jgi:hypothetical protein
MRHMHTNGDTSVDTSATDRATRHGLGQSYSIPEAAKVLGLTEEAVRQRVKRGTLDSIKVGGSLFVLLDSDTSNDTSSDRSIDQERHVGEGSSDTSRLVESLEDEVAHLRRQLDQANERDRENRCIIAGLVQRVPELEAPREPREVPESASEDTGRVEVPPEPQEPVERRSWLQRFFGFE